MTSCGVIFKHGSPFPIHGKITTLPARCGTVSPGCGSLAAPHYQICHPFAFCRCGRHRRQGTWYGHWDLRRRRDGYIGKMYGRRAHLCQTLSLDAVALLRDDVCRARFLKAYFDGYPGMWHHRDFIMMNLCTGDYITFGRRSEYNTTSLISCVLMQEPCY